MRLATPAQDQKSTIATYQVRGIATAEFTLAGDFSNSGSARESYLQKEDHNHNDFWNTLDVEQSLGLVPTKVILIFAPFLLNTDRMDSVLLGAEAQGKCSRLKQAIYYFGVTPTKINTVSRTPPIEQLAPRMVALGRLTGLHLYILNPRLCVPGGDDNCYGQMFWQDP